MTTEVETPTITSLIRALDTEHRDYSNTDITSLLIDTWMDDPDFVEIVRPAIMHYVSTTRRGFVRGVEQRLNRAWDPIDLEGHYKATQADLRDWLEGFADEYVLVGGERKRAGAMTLDDWQERIAELKAGIAADSQTVVRYEIMVDSLSRAKVQTIDAYLAKKR
jgi:hypothetical protein